MRQMGENKWTEKVWEAYTYEPAGGGEDGGAPVGGGGQVRVGVDVLDGAGRLEPSVHGDDAELVDMAGVEALHHHRVLVQLLLRHHPLRLLLLPKYKK